MRRDHLGHPMGWGLSVKYLGKKTQISFSDGTAGNGGGQCDQMVKLFCAIFGHLQQIKIAQYQNFVPNRIFFAKW